MVQDLGKPDDVILERSLIIVLVTCITLTKVKDKIVQLCILILGTVEGE